MARKGQARHGVISQCYKLILPISESGANFCEISKAIVRFFSALYFCGCHHLQILKKKCVTREINVHNLYFFITYTLRKEQMAEHHDLIMVYIFFTYCCTRQCMLCEHQGKGSYLSPNTQFNFIRYKEKYN